MGQNEYYVQNYKNYVAISSLTANVPWFSLFQLKINNENDIDRWRTTSFIENNKRKSMSNWRRAIKTVKMNIMYKTTRISSQYQV